MRLIDADALAKVKFHGYPEIEITPSDVNAEAYKRGWNDAIDAIIESAPSIDAVPQWIPVEEGLPKPGEYIGDVARYYLVQNEYGDMMVARYSHSEYWEQIYQLQPITDTIVAWMPLPEPYERKES